MSFPAGNSDDIDAACNAAEAAFEEWRAMPGKERKRLLHKVADAIEANAKDIALVESYDSGQALKFMGKAEKKQVENLIAKIEQQLVINGADPVFMSEQGRAVDFQPEAGYVGG